jgi:hypothetical protein
MDPIVAWGFANAVGCALLASQEIACWRDSRSSPVVPIPLPAGEFIALEVANGIVCGLRYDGTVSCGHGSCSCVGGPNFDECPESEGNWCDEGVSDLPGPFVEISVGDGICGRGESGQVSCWSRTGIEFDVEPPAGAFVRVGVGVKNACGILTDGNIVCWGGENEWNENDFEPGEYTKLSVGWHRTCALRTDGRITCCGGHVKDPITGEFIPPP